jgi:hypothetical protein
MYEGPDRLVIKGFLLDRPVTYSMGSWRFDRASDKDLKHVRVSSGEALAKEADPGITASSPQVFLARWTPFDKSANDGRLPYDHRLVWVVRYRNVVSPDFGGPGIPGTVGSARVWLVDLLRVVDASTGKLLVIYTARPDDRVLPNPFNSATSDPAKKQALATAHG